jgi:ketosteroid isomerase-like protein
MQTDKLTHPLVKSALTALDKGDAKGWFGLFTADAELYDDGNKVSFVPFFYKGHRP